MRTGRPRRIADEPTDQRINFRLTRSEKQLLQRRATFHRQDVSHYLRDIFISTAQDEEDPE